MSCLASQCRSEGPYLVSDTHRLSSPVGREDDSSVSQKLCLDVPLVTWQWGEHVSYPSSFPGSLFLSQAQPMILSSLVQTWVPHHLPPPLIQHFLDPSV